MSIMLSISLNKQVFELHYGFWQMLKTKSQSEDWLFKLLSTQFNPKNRGYGVPQVATEVNAVAESSPVSVAAPTPNGLFHGLTSSLVVSALS